VSARRRINLVFLGCGAITAVHSRRLARRRDEVRCFYASRDAERAMAYERRFGGGGSFGSYAAALADGRMDAVFVATPPHLHQELALQALAHDKDVIVETPAFATAAAGDAVRRARAGAGRQVLVAENYAYKPVVRVLRDALASGAVGEPRFLQLNAFKAQPAEDWRAQPGSGALFEGGVHWIDFAAHLGPAVVAVHGHRCGPKAGPERSSLVVFEYANGAVGTLAHSWETPSVFRGLQLSRIRGTEGSLLFESNGAFVVSSGRRRRLVFPGLRDLAGYDAMFTDFLAALRGERAPLMTLERALLDLALVETALSGGEHGPDAGAGHRDPGRGPHLDLGHVQGQPS